MNESQDETERWEKVKRRAYEIWLDQGQLHGQDEDNWRQAEIEIEKEEQGLLDPRSERSPPAES